jgi:hypothetical protein
MQMKWKFVVPGLVLMGTVGCASVNMSPDARLVRELTLDSGENCEFIGVFDTTVPSSTAGRMDINIQARNIVRNEVAAMGGDGFMLSSVNSGAFKYNVQYDAYDCGTLKSRQLSVNDGA